ncbi:serine hydrolase domain-containing protein [Streptomyces sp. LHD-70]|uniref:serine hydrolase domain-containing protein n=1 Tax=Streptomyces sp. LHD-70 TaxID=3072140 RepID=UPI00280FCDDF|nr:serine hydrolase domain-containing protein [Streptomyces sp. LHD-70]MDQ8704308.1 serine hydrolase domain-containing protein [Streptomyces sp. LHD-70]
MAAPTPHTPAPGHGSPAPSGQPSSPSAPANPSLRASLPPLATSAPAPGAAALSQLTTTAHTTRRYEATGTADTTTNRPVSRKDHFRIGSLTKSFTAVVVLQLAAEHRLTLDDTVERHLPGLIRGHGNDGRDLTLRQLLTHTSGLYAYTDAPGAPLTPHAPDPRTTTCGTRCDPPALDRHYTPTQLLRIALAHRPLFPPGTDWSYSNTNYTVLGLVIEKVTGRSYAEEARRRIITPLRLTGTSFPGTDRRLPTPHGRAYSGTPASATDVTELDPSGAGAAGEAISTLDDLNRFYAALLTGDLLPAPQLAAMRSTHSSDGVYGMGLMPTKLSCTTVWGHTGRIIGSYAATAATADGHHVLTYRLNSDHPTDTARERALLEAEFCGHRGR